MSSSSANNRRRSESGFTLMEVLIVMAILVFISLGIYQATTQTFRLRDDLKNEGEFYNSIRIAMGIVDRDVMQMYSPLIMIQNGPTPNPSSIPGVPGVNPGVSGAQRPGATPNMAQLPSNVAADLQQSYTYWSPAIDNSGLRPSHFVGNEKKFTFISSSHIRMYKDMPESDLVKIAYEFKRDEEGIPGLKIDDASVFTKTENVDAFENDDFKDEKSGVVYPLLHGITKFKIDYYDKRKEKWETTWDSEKVNNLYPDIIRMEFTIKGPSSLSFDGSYYFRPEAPLNGLNPSG